MALYDQDRDVTLGTVITFTGPDGTGEAVRLVRSTTTAIADAVRTFFGQDVAIDYRPTPHRDHLGLGRVLRIGPGANHHLASFVVDDRG